MTGSWESASCGSILYLGEGDRVYVQSRYYHPEIVTSDTGDNKFMGFMLNPASPFVVPRS